MTATRRPTMDEQRDPGHTFGTILDGPEGYVLRCRCGWESPSSRSAEEVGAAWDRHRAAPSATDN